MLADQFLEAAAGARTAAGLDELARKLWRAHGEGHLADADAEAIGEAVQARKPSWGFLVPPDAGRSCSALAAPPLNPP